MMHVRRVRCDWLWQHISSTETLETLQDAALHHPRVRGAAGPIGAINLATRGTDNIDHSVRRRSRMVMLALFRRRGQPLSAAAWAQLLGIDGSSVRTGHAAQEAALSCFRDVCGRCMCTT